MWLVMVSKFLQHTEWKLVNILDRRKLPLHFQRSPNVKNRVDVSLFIVLCLLKITGTGHEFEDGIIGEDCKSDIINDDIIRCKGDGSFKLMAL